MEVGLPPAVLPAMFAPLLCCGSVCCGLGGAGSVYLLGRFGLHACRPPLAGGPGLGSCGVLRGHTDPSPPVRLVRVCTPVSLSDRAAVSYVACRAWGSVK
ncbi:hypothetical protein GCM10010431_56710 [Streptomyces kunmingensis]